MLKHYKKSSISYHQRVLNWFNKKFRALQNPDYKSVLYHTYEPLVSELVQQHGKKMEASNQTYPDQLDTVYYMKAEFRHDDGKIEPVTVHHTVNFRGECYHRGFNRDENLFSPVEESSYQVNFPPLYDTDSSDYTVEKFENDSTDFYSTKEYKENKFCLRVKDSRNHVEIILFKPLRES